MITRLLQLRDVTKGLIYMHDQGIIHGNLNGVRFRTSSRCPGCGLPSPKANILIDNNGSACLAGFGQVTMVSDQSIITSSTTQGGTIRWMSPERFDPDRFGLEGNHPTKESDCYALGMVIYEVLSGETPYASHGSLIVAQKILDGERPSRPRGAQGKWFTAGLWGTLELCWEPQPGNRPSLNTVLRCLQGVETDINDRPDATASNSSAFSFSPLHLRLSLIISLLIVGCQNSPPTPPQAGGWKEKLAGNELVRGVRKLFKDTA